MHACILVVLGILPCGLYEASDWLPGGMYSTHTQYPGSFNYTRCVCVCVSLLYSSKLTTSINDIIYYSRLCHLSTAGEPYYESEWSKQAKAAGVLRLDDCCPHKYCYTALSLLTLSAQLGRIYSFCRGRGGKENTAGCCIQHNCIFGRYTPRHTTSSSSAHPRKKGLDLFLYVHLISVFWFHKEPWALRLNCSIWRIRAKVRFVIRHTTLVHHYVLLLLQLYNGGFCYLSLVVESFLHTHKLHNHLI